MIGMKLRRRVIAPNLQPYISRELTSMMHDDENKLTQCTLEHVSTRGSVSVLC
jgi:hypothetical protein